MGGIVVDPHDEGHLGGVGRWMAPEVGIYTGGWRNVRSCRNRMIISLHGGSNGVAVISSASDGHLIGNYRGQLRGVLGLLPFFLAPWHGQTSGVVVIAVSVPVGLVSPDSGPRFFLFYFRGFAEYRREFGSIS